MIDGLPPEHQTLSEILRDLVIANRILGHQGVVDVYGHISVRHPDNPNHYFMSCSRAPALVTLRLSDLRVFREIDGPHTRRTTAHRLVATPQFFRSVHPPS